MKQNNRPPFITNQVYRLLKNEVPFNIKGLDFRLLPLFFPLIKKRVFVVYDFPFSDIYGGLLLAIQDGGVFYDKDFGYEKNLFLRGFSGAINKDREVFLSSLRVGFLNHRFVLFPSSLLSVPLFSSPYIEKGVVVTKATPKDLLVESLSSLQYCPKEFVQERGDFCVRGMVVDFFPFDSTFGVRVLFDNKEASLFCFNVENQLVFKSLDCFVLKKPFKKLQEVAVGSFIDPLEFSYIYLSSKGVSFFKKSPKKAVSLSVSSLPLDSCFGQGVAPFSSPCVVGFKYNNRVFAPSWSNPSRGTPLTNDLYTDFSLLEKGDFLIHEGFGVGKYLGLSSSAEGESLVLSYQGSKINVFPSYFDKVSFFKKRGSEIKEDFIGRGSSWRRRVVLAEKQASSVAQELIDSYSKRKTTDSDVYFLDKELEKEFLKGFSFQDTPDQASVWQKIKRDLFLKSPMDRLLCGDVGFGKTEIAIRAAFMAAVNGFGVAVLAPTTILANQLFLSFKERLSPYSIKTGLLSRLVSIKEQKLSVDRFLSGEVGVLVGTNKIVSSEPLLKKCSLFIIDDEHRFGVGQKEAIKQANPRANILYMSATPIPRTLQMALSEIKSISTLSSPPTFKIPTKTFVDYFSKRVLSRAILPEVARGGQVFFVHNNVQKIPFVVSFLKDLFPSLRISFLHGQEPVKTIGSKMASFLNKEIDVLVASSIVENGVDIPSVNTIIINDAHFLGLSQLYQMRGRVGRGSVPSFAYLLIPQEARLSSAARHRLKIIENNSSLGSFYAVSLEDLNLRGAGAVFGYKQSGAVKGVGFELYNRVLEQKIKSFKKEKVVKERCFVSFLQPAFIPKDYVPSIKLRVWLYKEISSVQSIKSLVLLEQKIENLFGPIPLFLNNLLNIKRVQVLGEACYFSKIIIKDGFGEVFLNSFFWKNKIDSLFSVLFGFKFTVLEGGLMLRFKLVDDIFLLNPLNSVYDLVKTYN